MGQFEIIEFYLDLVRGAQARGIRCAITSGMACVAFEIAESTKDCDLLCDPEMADNFLGLLAESPLGDSPCRYRGNISPPLDGRWLKGGWTSHFEWPGTDAFLDVFGIAPRARSSWLEGSPAIYAHPHVVADMKRTGRDKDWPFLTGLGIKLVEGGDPRGWLHIYDEDRMADLLVEHPEIPPAILESRPLLRILTNGVPGLAVALRLERTFWMELSKLRVREYEKPLRPYLAAVRTASAGKRLSLLEDHQLRVACAEDHLPPRPLSPDILDAMIASARTSAMMGMTPDLACWLPNVIPNFTLLIPGLESPA
jgi:hypothetical protein